MSCIFIINKGIFPYTISFIGDKMTYDKTIGYDDFDIQNEVQKLQMLFILPKFTVTLGPPILKPDLEYAASPF